MSLGTLLDSRLLDNPVRHVVQNLMMRSPLGRVLARRYHTTGIEHDPERALTVLRDLLSLLEEASVGLTDRVVIELGPGQTPDLLYLALLLGARRVVGLDVLPYLGEEVRVPSTYEALLRLIAQDDTHGWLRPRLDLRRFGDARRIPETSLQVRRFDGTRMPVDSETVDVVWSRSALEHVREPAALVGEIRRVLKPGGVVCSIIDLRDHYSMQPGQDWLRFLRYSRPVWELMTSHRGSYTNRLRSRDWEALFADHGLERLVARHTLAPLPPDFALERLHPAFRHYPLDELRVSWLMATHRKRAA